jgi:hypothetical protein
MDKAGMRPLARPAEISPRLVRPASIIHGAGVTRKPSKSRRNRRAERLLREVLSERFAFEQSEADLELLRSIHDGTYADTRPGDPSFHAYAAAVNAANDFAGQVLGFPDLIPFNNRLADIQEEYMPSYPPMSPVTSAFFAGWVVLDARDWDIAGKQEVRCWSSSGYAGRKGEIWYVRVLPPYVEGLARSVSLSTPYVFTDSSRSTWEDFFRRRLSSESTAGHPLRDYLKNGKSLGYWLEFVHRAFAGYTGNMILVTGVRDDPASLPHFDPKNKLE